MKTMIDEMDAPASAAQEPAPDAPDEAPGYLTSGLDLLVHVIRHPEALFRAASPEPVLTQSPIDSLELTRALRRYFNWSGTRCMDAYARMRIAAGLALLMDVKVCSGPMDVDLFEDPEDCSLSLKVTVCADATAERVAALNDALLQFGTRCCVYISCLHLEFQSLNALRAREAERRRWLLESKALATADESDESDDD